MFKNQNELDKKLDDLITEAEKEIDKVHAKRLKTINNRLADMYQKYETNGKLTLADMTKYNRLQKELDFIFQEIDSQYKYLTRFIGNLRETQYIENYYKSAYLYEFEAQQKLGFGKLSKSVIQKAIENQIKELTLSYVMEHNRNDIVKRINTELAQGLQAGESYAQMAKRVKNTINFSAYKSRTVARTEAHRCQQQGRMDAAEQANKYVNMTKDWDSTLDRHTRPWHRTMDGRERQINKDFHTPVGGVGPAPGHMHLAKDDINCRCTVVYLVNGEKPSIRRSRLSNGKTEVIPYMNYSEWEKARL